jgi:signal transduction histidine kinase
MNIFAVLKICLVALLLTLFSFSAGAQDLVLERAIFEDATGQMTLAQAKDAQFAAAPASIFKGFSRSAFWVRLKIDAPAGTEPLSVRIRPSLLDKATLYYPAAQLPGGEVALQMDVRAKQNQTQISLAPGLHTLYLRAESIGPVLIQAQVLSPAGATRQDLSFQFTQGVLISLYALTFMMVLGLCYLGLESYIYFFFLHLCVSALQHALTWDVARPYAAWEWALGAEWVRFGTIWNFLSFLLLAQSIFGHFKMPRAQRLVRYVALLFAVFLSLYFLVDQHLLLKFSYMCGAATALVLMLFIAYTAVKFFSDGEMSLVNRLLIGTLVTLYVLHGVIASLQLLQVIEGELFLLGTPLVRSIFIPVALIILIWQRDKQQKSALAKTEIELAIFNARTSDQAKRLETQSQFMAMLMHELKTPLYIIQLAAASIRGSMALTKSDSKRVDNIALAVDDMGFIIDRCAQADQLDQNAGPPMKVPVGLKSLLFEATHINGHERISYLGLAEGLMSSRVVTDYQYARIILINLITNALKYSPPESTVQLSAEPALMGGVAGLTIRVSNSVGSSGPPDPLKVFTRYYRSEGAKKEVGAGLGLWLAHTIATRLGTELRCSCTGELVHFEFFLELS